MQIPQNIVHRQEYAEELFGSFDTSKNLVLQRGLFDAYDEGFESWIIMKDAYFWSARFQALIHAPAGFITDFASIPRLARPLFTGHGKTRYPAIPHDVLYSYKRTGLCEDFSRKEMDLILKDFCVAKNMTNLATEAVYRAVRIGGGFALRDKKYLSFATPDVFQKYLGYHPELSVA